ncbi:hypothetical protein [Microbacterium sp. A93]
MDERENLVARRQILGAVLLAMENAPRVLQVCANASGDNDVVATALAAAFGISEFEAQIILDMQVK